MNEVERTEEQVSFVTYRSGPICVSRRTPARAGFDILVEVDERRYLQLSALEAKRLVTALKAAVQL